MRPGNPITIRDVLTPVFFFKNRAIVGFIIPIVLAFAAALLSQPQYVAESRLLILLGDDYVFKSPLGSAMPGLSFDKSQIINAETEILGSREVATDVIRKVGLKRLFPGADDSPAALQAGVDNFQASLTIQNVPQSNIVAVSYRNRDRDAAIAAVKALVEIYLERRRDIFEQSNQGSIERQIIGLNAQLAETEARISEFSTKHGFADYEDELSTVQAQQAALTSQGDNLDQELAIRTGRAEMLRQRQDRTPEEVELSKDLSRSQEIDSLTQSLLSLQNQRRVAAAQFTDGNALVADLDRRIAQVERELRTAPREQTSILRKGQNPLRQDLDTQLQTAVADEAGYRRGKNNNADMLKRVNQRMVELVAIGPEYRELLRTRTVLESTAAELAKRSQDIKLADSLSRAQANVRVVQDAQAPMQARGGRTTTVLAGIVVGIIAAGAVTVLSVALFEGMLTPHEVEQKLETPVILAPNNDESFHASSHGALPAPFFLTQEDVKVLNRVLQSLKTTPCRSVMMIGPNDHTGVTSLLIDIALVSVREGQRILMLDLEPQPGHSASDLLAARGATLDPLPGGSFAQVNNTSFHVLLPDDGLNLAMGEAEWKTLLGQACKDYDLVLVDSPPLSRSWLGLFAAPSVDATLAVVAAEETRSPVARNMIDRINGAGGEVVAAVFNRRRFYIPRLIYNWL